MADAAAAPLGTDGSTARRPRWLRAAVALALLLVLAAIADGGLALRELRTAESEARAARTALETGSLAAALTATDAASQAATSAQRRLSRPHWQLTASLPLIGSEVATLRALADVGAAAAGVVDAVLQASDPASAGGTPTLVRDGRLDLDLLRAVSDAVAGADLEGIEAARADLSTAAERARAASLREASDQALTVTEEVTTLLPEAGDSLSLLLDLLGGEGTRRYLVAVQNPGELRGTGGLIGFLAVLEFRDGAVTLAEPTGIDADTAIDGTVLVPLGAFSRTTRFSIEAPEEYQARYGSVGGAVFLPSTNVDPDLPTVAPLVLAQYEQASGEELDGLVALDPLALELLFTAIGPLEVPADAARLSPDLPDPIPAERIAEVLLVDSYEALGGGSPERRRYHAEVAAAALRTGLSGEWEPLEVARALLLAVGARHLQVHSTDAEEQRRLEELGIAGALRPQEDGDDLLALTAVNIGGNKADVHVAHELRHHLRLEVDDTDGGAQLWRRSESRLRVRNAVDPDSDPYISTSLVPTRPDEPRQTTGELGLVRSWVTLWAPPDAELVSATDLDGDPIGTWRDRIHGLETVDHLLDTPNEQETGFEVQLAGSTGIDIDGDTVTYPLTLWRQAKGVADHLEVTIDAPAGWRIDAVEVTADGPEIGLGPAPFTAPVEVSAHTADTVHLEGSMTADVRVTLELVRDG